MTAIRMTSLRRAPNGDWLARKMVPKDVRAGTRPRLASPKRPASVHRHRPAGTPPSKPSAIGTPRSPHGSNVSAEARGEGLPSLTHRQVHALVGDWYVWFVAQHEEEPGTPEQWDFIAEEYETSFSKFASADGGLDDDHQNAASRSPVVRRSVHRALVIGLCGRVPSQRNVVLADEAKSVLLDALEDDFLPALATLRRRADGNYERDRRPEKFPAIDPSIARPYRRRWRQAEWPHGLGGVRALDRRAQAGRLVGEPLAGRVPRSA